ERELGGTDWFYYGNRRICYWFREHLAFFVCGRGQWRRSFSICLSPYCCSCRYSFILCRSSAWEEDTVWDYQRVTETDAKRKSVGIDWLAWHAGGDLDYVLLSHDQGLVICLLF